MGVLADHDAVSGASVDTFNPRLILAASGLLSYGLSRIARQASRNTSGLPCKPVGARMAALCGATDR
jgi:hypothetical protein